MIFAYHVCLVASCAALEAPVQSHINHPGLRWRLNRLVFA